MATALKKGGSKRQTCNDRHFVIIRLCRNLITLPTDVSKSCILSECCLHSFKHTKIYNRAKTKTCHLPGYGPLKKFAQGMLRVKGTPWDKTFLIYMKLYSLLILTENTKKSKNNFKVPKKSEIVVFPGCILPFKQNKSAIFSTLHHIFPRSRR